MSEIEPLAGAGAEMAESLHVVAHTMAAGAGTEGGPLPPPLETSKTRAWPSSRVLAILVVVATLAAASVGYLLNRAAAGASDNNGRAQQVALRASAADTAATQTAENDYSLYLADQELRAKAGQEMLEAGLPSSNPAQRAADFAATTAQEAQAAQRIPKDVAPLLPGGDPDPNFPSDLIAQRTSAATALAADSSGYNDAGQKWASLVTTYTVVVTLIAVSLFLFGSAFGLLGAKRLLFTGLGLTALVSGVVWGGAATVLQEPQAPVRAPCASGGEVVAVAACAYAAGQLAVSKAVVPSDEQAAINDFSAAITARPDYAQAYHARATAEWTRGSQQIGLGFISNVDPYWAQRSADDDLRAYDLGDHDADVASSAGFDLYQLWLMPRSAQCSGCGGGQGSPPSRALTLTSEAAALDPTNPVAWMNVGIVNIAQRQYREAAHDYALAAAHILYSDVDHHRAQPLSDHQQQQAWLAGGMTDLEGLAASTNAQHDTNLRGVITTMEGVLTGSLATGSVVSAPPPPPVKFSQDDLGDLITAKEVALVANVPRGASESSLANEPATVLWYERAANGDRWNGIAEATSWGALSKYFDDQAQDFTFIANFLNGANACFPARQYKAEIYLRGALAGSLSSGPDAIDLNYTLSSDLTAALAPSMNVGVCVPSGWHMQQPLPVQVPVFGSSQLLKGTLSELHWASSDGSSGVYALRLYAPHTTYIGGDSAVQDEVASMAIAVAGPGGLLSGHGLPNDVLAIPTDLTNLDNCDQGGDDTVLREAGFTRQNCSWMALTDSEEGAFTDRTGATEAIVAAGVETPGATLPSNPAGQDAGSDGIASSVASDDAFIVVIVYGPANKDLWTDIMPIGLQIERSASLLGFG